MALSHVPVLEGFKAQHSMKALQHSMSTAWHLNCCDVGQVEGHNCVVCPYHGWAFDGEGVLRDVPAAENRGEWPTKQLVDVYPVVEKVSARLFVCLIYTQFSRRMPSLAVACLPSLLLD